jgi:hypothetical protein
VAAGPGAASASRKHSPAVGRGRGSIDAPTRHRHLKPVQHFQTPKGGRHSAGSQPLSVAFQVVRFWIREGDLDAGLPLSGQTGFLHSCALPERQRLTDVPPNHRISLNLSVVRYIFKLSEWSEDVRSRYQCSQHAVLPRSASAIRCSLEMIFSSLADVTIRVLCIRNSPTVI